MMIRARPTLGIALLFVIALFVPVVFQRPAEDDLKAGAATPPPNTTEPEAARSPEPAPPIVPSCGTATVSFDGAEATTANRTEGALVVSLGTVESIGAAQWNTDDGKAPSFDRNPPMDAYIYQPVAISITTLARGDVADSKLEVRSLGGTVGCYTYDYEGAPGLEIGGQYAFFFGPTLMSNGGRSQSTFTINDAWPLIAGRVTTPLEGEVPLADFVDAVKSAPVGPMGR